jgi:hypothetical protein
MKLPKKCPHCGVTFGATPHGYLMIRTNLDFDSEDESRIEDQIFECSNCHTLFRARYELIGFTELQEKEAKSHET